MAYVKNWVASPNYTPAAQTQAAYGQPRSIRGGAGHWWNLPSLAGNHDGIVSFMANPARQAAPHAVLSDGRVTEMVRDSDTAWCTAQANPYTFAIEIDPRIMYKWGYDGASGADQAHGERIFQTLCEYIADKGYHNLPWKPHNVWAPGTQCNPIPYDQVMARAQQIVAERQTPAVKEVARDVYNPLKKFIVVQDCILERIPNGGDANPGKIYRKGEFIDIKQRLTMSDGSVWYRTAYSSDNELATGFRDANIDEYVPTPEWIINLVDTADVKLFVLPAAGTPVINLNTGQAIPESVIAKGTAVDIAKTTTVGGKQYLISSYSASRNMPNGILASDLGALAEPPKQEKPEWLKNLHDIADVTMYTRAEVPLVNLVDGKTIKMLPINTAVEIATATEVAGLDYFISKYATDNNQPNGILVAHLDANPIKEPTKPAEPAPTQPSLEQRVGIIEAFINALKALLEKIGIKL